jgi:7,8-dihydropterin-6-yl-methyl-4-(beta-D-ribofuranosyl)aminobenzene 5'-phosphate synthase
VPGLPDRGADATVIALVTFFTFILAAALAAAPAQSPKRITILYDAFAARAQSLEMDWGFAALIEYGGRRILFDTGNDARVFEHNVVQLGVDLRNLDAVVISHRHGDHTSGLSYLLQVSPAVKIYTPVEGAFFKAPLPLAFLARDASVPAEMKYFGGHDPVSLVSGTPWEKANFEAVAKTTEILPGFFVITTRSAKPGTNEMNEISLAVRTAQGVAVIVGCSHPGVEKVLENAASIDQRLYTVTGGFHLVQTARPEIERVASALHDELKVQRVAPGHCTSEAGFAVFMDRFGERFDRAGLGAVIPLP